MGTVAYMSPEQVQGLEVDYRSDIWALGCVLYEMVRGQRPFGGQYDQALAYEIVHQELEPLTAVRAGLPMEVEFIVGKCLAKAIEDRYGHADEIAKDLRSLGDKLKSGRSTILNTAVQPQPGSAGAKPAASDGPALASPGLGRKLRLYQALAAATMVALAILAFLYFSEAPLKRPVSRWSFAPADLQAGSQPVSVSPDGRHIVYEAGPGRPRLWVRDVDRLEPRELPGTEGALRPFWSPDSRFIGFAAEGELRKISVEGGPPITLCAVTGRFWTESGGSRVFEVPAEGGLPKLLFEPQDVSNRVSNSHPHFLPLEAKARSLLLRVKDSAFRNQIVVKNLETGEAFILANGERPVYAPSGHIIFDWQDGQWALPFSLDTLRLGLRMMGKPLVALGVRILQLKDLTRVLR